MAVLDYSKRRQVPQNRPKSRGGGLLVAGIFAGVALIFATGFGAGWFAGKSAQKKAAALQERAEAARKAESAAAAAPAAAPGNAMPPLTFYNTLKGGRDVIGTGINSPKPVEKGNEVYTVSQGSPPVAAPTKGPEAKPADPVKSSTVKAVEQQKVKFTVQVASYRDKKEAEAARDRVAAGGMPAFIMESHQKDHGVWYRLRVGKGLEQKEATALLPRLGKGALLVPE